MALFPFDVKEPKLYFDQVRGFPCVHPDVREMLVWLAALCEAEKLARPFVTEFGRTREDQEAIYLPTMLQNLEHNGVGADAHAKATAREAARQKFSWHCIPIADDKTLGFCRAFDLRYSVWSDEKRRMLLDEARKKWPRAELLDHRVQGNARHLHLGLPQPDGIRPHDWL